VSPQVQLTTPELPATSRENLSDLSPSSILIEAFFFPKNDLALNENQHRAFEVLWVVNYIGILLRLLQFITGFKKYCHKYSIFNAYEEGTSIHLLQDITETIKIKIL